MLDRQTDRGIQILRIISCFAVFFCHFGQRMKFSSFSANLYGFSQLGRFGVELFFLISGYLVCYSLFNGKSTVRFYIKRAVRILPLYYFCILYYFLTETFLFRAIPEDTMHLGWTRYVFCLNGIVPSEGYFWGNIGITWTIPVFIIFYLLAPLLFRISKSFFSSTVMLICSILVSVVVHYKGQGWFSAFTYMPCFIAGIVVYRAKKENRRFIAIIEFQLLVFLAKFCTWSGYIEKATQSSEFLIVAFVFASVILFSNEIDVRGKKVIKVLDYLDERSYTLYLVHGITFCGILDKDVFSEKLLNAFGNTVAVVIFRVVVAVVLTGFLTVIIHKYFEKPVQKKLKKLLLK